MSIEKELKSWDIEGDEVRKFDFDEFDPKPLEPGDLEEIPASLESVSKERLKIEKSKPENSKPDREPEEPFSALRSALTAFSLVGQIGLVMFASVAIGLIGGMYLDRWLGTGHVFMIVLTLLGVASGFRAVFLMVKKLMN